MVPTGWCTGLLGAQLAVLFPALDPSEAGLAGGRVSLMEILQSRASPEEVYH